MYFKILISHILGYVTIEVEGYFIERFINLCNKQKILLWNMQRSRSTIMKVNISKKDFKKLKPIAKKTRCNVKIKRKKGLPFFFHRYKKRKLFLMLFISIILICIAMSNFIWNIDITGNDKIPKEEILQAMEKDLKIGTCKIGLKTKQIVENIRMQREDIAWIGIEIKGTNAIVKIVEADLKPEIIKEDEYCNLIATKEGMITKISAGNGTAVVKEGDIVTKGSILVGGWLEGKYTGMRYVHATGEVQAKVWYSQKAKVSLKSTKKVETGNSKTRYSVKINNFHINFAKSLPKFQKYDTIESVKKLRLFSNFYLPIEICEKNYIEYQEQEVSYTLEEAKNIAIEEAKKVLDEQIENKNTIVKQKINEKQTDKDVEVEVIYEVLENIATNEKIVF